MTNELFHDRVMDAAIDYGLTHRKVNSSGLKGEWQTYYNSLPAEYKKFADLTRLELFSIRHREKNLHPAEYLLFIQKMFGSFKSFAERYLIEYFV